MSRGAVEVNRMPMGPFDAKGVSERVLTFEDMRKNGK